MSKIRLEIHTPSDDECRSAWEIRLPGFVATGDTPKEIWNRCGLSTLERVRIFMSHPDERAARVVLEDAANGWAKEYAMCATDEEAVRKPNGKALAWALICRESIRRAQNDGLVLTPILAQVIHQAVMFSRTAYSGMKDLKGEVMGPGIEEAIANLAAWVEVQATEEETLEILKNLPYQQVVTGIVAFNTPMVIKAGAAGRLSKAMKGHVALQVLENPRLTREGLDAVIDWLLTEIAGESTPTSAVQGIAGSTFMVMIAEKGHELNETQAERLRQIILNDGPEIARETAAGNATLLDDDKIREKILEHATLHVWSTAIHAANGPTWAKVANEMLQSQKGRALWAQPARWIHEATSKQLCGVDKKDLVPLMSHPSADIRMAILKTINRLEELKDAKKQRGDLKLDLPTHHSI